jgi:hypothetical protein
VALERRPKAISKGAKMKMHLNQSPTAKCSLCGELIPVGHEFFKRNKYAGKQHTNCEEYKSWTAILKREALQQSLDAQRMREYLGSWKDSNGI